MTALVILGDPGPLVSFAQMFALAFIVPIGLLLAPQPIRRDRRTLALLVVTLALVIGGPVYAVVCNVCALCQTEWWWLYVECWFL